MTPERLAEIAKLRDSSMPRSDERGLMAGAIDELLAALHLAARMTSFSREPCPLCLSLYGVSEVCALHHEIDELGFHSQRHVARIAELEKQNSRFVAIITASETAKDVADTVDTLAAARERIAVLEAGLREAEQLGRPSRGPRDPRVQVPHRCELIPIFTNGLAQHQLHERWDSLRAIANNTKETK